MPPERAALIIEDADPDNRKKFWQRFVQLLRCFRPHGISVRRLEDVTARVRRETIRDIYAEICDECRGNLRVQRDESSAIPHWIHPHAIGNTLCAAEDLRERMHCLDLRRTTIANETSAMPKVRRTADRDRHG